MIFFVKNVKNVKNDKNVTNDNLHKMAKYESKVNYTPHATAEQVYAKLSNLESFKPLLENLADNPLVRQKIEEEGQDPKILEQLKDVKLTADTITFPVPMLGSMTLEIIEREENRCIKMQAANVPMEGNLWIQVLPVSTGGSKMRLTLKAELNMMMKMMIGSKLQKGIDNMAAVLAQLPYQMM